MALAHFPGAPASTPSDTHAYGPIDASAADGRQRINTLSALALDGDISGPDEFTVQETAFRRVSRRTPKVVELQRLSLHVPTRITVYVASRDNAVTTSTHGVHYESN